MQHHLFLADLANLSENEVKDHISVEYSGVGCGVDRAALRADLDNFDILVVYESVGDYGCDSSSYFLIRDKLTNQLSEVRGSHCSCYGFEGQWELEAVELMYLTSGEFYMGTGGYDDSAAANEAAVKDFFKSL